MNWFTIGILLILVVLLTLAGLWLFDSYRAYAKVSADQHFREVEARLPALKRAALERIISSASDAVCTPEDPRGMLTSAGLAVLYLIGREGCCFHHDLSVSWPNRAYTPRAVGNMFICFLAHLLGVGLERLYLRVSSKTVHHAAFTLNTEEQDQFASRALTCLSSEELAAFRGDWALGWKRIKWECVP
jgi:hypothetical protein